MVTIEFYVGLLAATVVTSLGVAGFVLVRRKHVPSAKAGAACLIGGAAWTAGYGLELSAGSVAGSLFWENLQYLGIASVVPAWLAFTLIYAGKKDWLSKRNILLLVTCPVVFVILGFTNGYHGLIYGPASMVPQPDGTVQLVHDYTGVVMYAYAGFSYLVFLVVLVVNMALIVRARTTYSSQILLNLLAGAAPIIGSIYDLGGFSASMSFDVTPAAFAVTGLAIGYNIIRGGLFDILPLARGVILESIHDAVYVLDVRERVIDLNEVGARMIGADPRDIIGASFQEVAPDWMRALPSPGEREGQLIELEDDSGQQIRFYEAKLSSLAPGGGAILGRVLLLHDVTERKLAEQRLTHQAMHDTLTGLPNRLLLRDRLETAIARCRRYPQRTFALLFLDLDRFKVINDGMGHSVGDQVLIEVASRLKTCVRGSDTVARLGGDEFVILLDEIHDESEAISTAERALEIFEKPIQVEDAAVYTSTSIGIAYGMSPHDDAESLLRNADTAMYQAKASGAGSYRVFNQFMHSKAVALMRLETDLRQALEAEEFFLLYQPVYRLEPQRLVGLEALVRWAHPERGTLLPHEFIRVAEETGLILPLGDWILARACRDMQEWLERFPELGELTMSVNISGDQLWKADLIASMNGILEESGLNPNCVAVEITESAFMKDINRARRTLTELQRLGVGIHIDDFGTGYSSLSVLHSLPVDRLKIDHSFIARIGQQQDEPDILQAVLELARSLRIETVAEAIETPQQLERLREFGCTYGQGHLLAPPLPRQAVPGLWQQASKAAREQRG